MSLTEIWFQSGDDCQVSELYHLFYDCSSQPRLIGRSGGLAAVFHKWFKCYLIKVTDLLFLLVIFLAVDFNIHVDNPSYSSITVPFFALLGLRVRQK